MGLFWGSWTGCRNSGKAGRIELHRVSVQHRGSNGVGWKRILSLVGDIALYQASFVLAFLLRFLGNPPIYNERAYLVMAPWVSLFQLALFSLYGLYDRERHPWRDIGAAIPPALFLSLIFDVALSFYFETFSFPRSVFLIAFLLQVPALWVWRRFLWDWEQRRTGKMGLLLVGPQEGVDPLCTRMAAMVDTQYLILDTVRFTGGEEPGEILEAVTRAVTSHPGVEGVLLAPGVSPELKMMLGTEVVLKQLALLILPDLYEIFLLGARLTRIDDIPVLSARGLELPLWASIVKRGIDLAAAILGLLLFWPIMGGVALLVRMTSPGPILHRQERMSEDGRVFTLYKFRTMWEGAERESGPVLATARDPRLTPIGGFLRLSHLDELPQLFNILRGDMSLVGPRPERPYFVEQFQDRIPYYAERHRIKTGLTGLAQVEGSYHTAPEEKLKYDLLYARSYSPWLDVRILLFTLRSLFQKGRAL